MQRNCCDKVPKRWAVTDRTKRQRRFQYSIRTLLLLVCVCAVAFETIRWLGVAESVSIALIVAALYVGFLMPTDFLSKTRLIRARVATKISESGRLEDFARATALSIAAFVLFVVAVSAGSVLLSQLLRLSAM